jgi:hypothetical protein
VAHAQLRCLRLDLALAGVGEELRRAQDRVDDRADEGDERGRGGRRDEDRVGDTAPCVGPRPIDEGQPDDHENQDQQIDREVQRAVVNSEQRCEHAGARQCKRMSGKGRRRAAM